MLVRPAPLLAPKADRAVAVRPTAADYADALDRNRDSLVNSPARVGGVPLAEFRAVAQAELLELARAYHAEFGEPTPASGDGWVLAGHQPEFFHPGVWVKNWLLASVARRSGRAALNLIVDNDTAKSTHLRLPILSDDPDGVGYARLAFDRFDGEIPYETRPVKDPALFDSFADRLGEQTRDWPYEPMIGHAWAEAVSLRRAGFNLGQISAKVRRCYERRMGVTNWELPISRLADGTSFAAFGRAVLADLPRFHAAYNAALAEYRVAYGIRSASHPLPDLGERGGQLEAPFWIWREGERRRERLWASPSFNWDDAVRKGFRIRPRALTNTMFARLALSDGFVHGIGGGKYDEITDEIIRRWLALEPPGIMVASASLWLPLPGFKAGTAEVRANREELRRLLWRPETAIDGGRLQPATELLARRSQLAKTATRDVCERRRLRAELREIRTGLRQLISDRIDAAESRLEASEREAKANAILRRRDYSWLLYPEHQVREFMNGATVGG